MVRREALAVAPFVAAWPAVVARWAGLVAWGVWLARQMVSQQAAQKVIGQEVPLIHPAVHFAA